MNKRLAVGSISLGLLLPVFVIGASSAAAQTDSCVTAQCHASIGKDKVVHSPVREGMCTACHQTADDPLKKTKHPGNLIITTVLQGSGLCYQCHEPKNKKKVVHAPIKGGDCTSCHDPHQSVHKAMLRESMPRLCYQCHPDTFLNRKFPHKPVTAGACATCHDNHESDFAGRILREGNALCFGCHPDKDKELKTNKSVHPAAVQGCTQCHDQHGSAHRGMVKATEPALCYQCHESKNTKKVVHAPVKAGDCTSCHDPHATPNKGMLKASVPQNCFQCHSADMVKRKAMHAPVAGGDCSNCHDNHQSDHRGRTVSPGNALCFQCHADKEEAVRTKKAVHAPVKQSCVMCHNPHGTDVTAMLAAPVPEMCSNCHPGIVALRAKAMAKHGPMSDAKSCRNCHDPHYADQPRLLPSAQLALCLGCHDKELNTGRGRIANMKALLEANKNAHGPVKKGECAACHNPHGSDHWRILVKAYPGEFYSAFSEGRYELCFSCHDKAAFTERQTTKKTGFRDDDRNLHYLHVNKIVKGRTCRACHEVHADKGQAKHVSTHVEFSGWAMPLNFVPGKSGGTCTPGCHGEKRYTR